MYTPTITDEMRAKSLEVRRAKALARRTDPLAEIKDNLSGLFKELLDAAMGRGSWKDLHPDRRLLALNKVLEYGYGRTITLDKTVEKPSGPTGEGGEAEQAEGLSIE